MANIQQKLDLQDDQRFALMKFRRNVSDIIKTPDQDDYYLCRWLRARKWNPEEAEKMLRESMRQRLIWDIDNIKNWQCPQILKDYLPYGTSGYDKEGSPIIIVPFAGMDMWGTLHCVSRSDFIRAAAQILEDYMQLSFNQSKIHGYKARQLVVLFDMENFYFKQYAWRPAAELVISLIKHYELNYPEILKICYIINAPKIFSLAFNVVKKFLDDYTMSKIMIFKSGSDKWLPKLLSHVDQTQLPEYYGGTQTDKDGDPMCKSKICWGGRIPKTMYSKNKEERETKLEEQTIGKGSKLKLEFICKDEGAILKWEFRILNHDIRFGVLSIENNTKEKQFDVPLMTINSNDVNEIGFITCKSNTKYIVVFDNSYSILRSKKILYSINLLPSLNIIEKEADRICNNDVE